MSPRRRGVRFGAGWPFGFGSKWKFRRGFQWNPSGIPIGNPMESSGNPMGIPIPIPGQIQSQSQIQIQVPFQSAQSRCPKKAPFNPRFLSPFFQAKAQAPSDQSLFPKKAPAPKYLSAQRPGSPGSRGVSRQSNAPPPARESFIPGGVIKNAEVPLC